MKKSLRDWGPDGAAVLIEDNAGFGHLNLINTPQAVHENLPRKHANCIITAEGRIDNRDKLCHKLGIGHPQRPAALDSDLFLRAYEKWGRRCVEHILGDYSFAIWHPEQQTLFLARDHHGCTSLYFYDCDQFFAFATSIHALLALPQIPKKLNERRLAQTMISIHGDLHLSFHEGINHLLSAHTLTLSDKGLQIDRYWDPRDVPLLHLKSEEAYAEGLREVLGNAVNNQLRSQSPVGIALSSGLDSTAVAAFAAPKLQENQQPLSAFSWVPTFEDLSPYGRRLLNEKPLVDKMVQRFDNIQLTAVGSANYGLVDSIIRTLDHCPRPSFAAGNIYWHLEMWDLAQSRGIRSVLNGRAGNMTISWSGTPASVKLSTLLKQQQWRYALGYKLLLPLIPTRYKKRKIKQLQQTILHDAAINPEFARRLNLIEMFGAEAERSRLHNWQNPRQTRCDILMTGGNVLEAMNAEIVGPFGLEWRDPTAHVEVIEYTLSVPDHIFGGKSGQDRRLVRVAMQDLLPPEIVWNDRRGLQSSDILPRMKADGQAIDQVLRSFQEDHMVQSYVDLPTVNQTWLRIKNDAMQSIGIKDRGLVLMGIRNGLFLQKYFPNGA